MSPFLHLNKNKHNGVFILFFFNVLLEIDTKSLQEKKGVKGVFLNDHKGQLKLKVTKELSAFPEEIPAGIQSLPLNPENATLKRAWWGLSQGHQQPCECSLRGFDMGHMMQVSWNSSETSHLNTSNGRCSLPLE